MYKVLHILWGGETGTAQQYVKQLVNEKSTENIEHHIFLVTKEGSLLNSVTFDLPIISANCVKLNQLDYCALRINTTILEWGIDLVHCHSTNVFVLG